MKTWLIALLSIISAAVQAQTNEPEGVSVRMNKPLQVVYNNIDDMLRQQVINNAIEVRLSVNPQKRYNVFARINAGADNSLVGKISLRHINNTSYNANVNTTDVILTNTPTLLITQPEVLKHEEFYFFYDCVINPFSTFTNIGQFNFSINFTVTEP